LLSRKDTEVLRYVGLKRLCALFALNGTKKNRITGHVEPKSVKLVASLLSPYRDESKFVRRFLACFKGMDYRSLVIAIWDDQKPPSKLLRLKLPCKSTDPGPVLYYETLRLKGKRH
jgi:hypothetical protein